MNKMTFKSFLDFLKSQRCVSVYFQTLNMNIKDISIAFILKFLLIMEKAVKKYTLILVPGLNGMGLFINLAKFVSLD